MTSVTTSMGLAMPSYVCVCVTVYVFSSLRLLTSPDPLHCTVCVYTVHICVYILWCIFVALPTSLNS